jgi:PTH1 family peptidyl-tRNA hydrolase
MPVDNAILIVGLGNPGHRYERTRHNAGFMVLDDISDRFNIPLDRKKHDAAFGRGTIEGRDVILAKPMAFMNNSGPPIQQLAHFFKIPAAGLFIIHDDIDLVYGRLKIMERGGHGGHKGIESLNKAFNSSDFPRLRIGVGRPDITSDVTNHVLGRFTGEEADILGEVISSARKALLLLLKKGVTEAMNQVNKRKLLISN